MKIFLIRLCTWISGVITSSKAVDMPGMGLTFIPDDVLNNVELEWLYLDGNELTELPVTIGNLNQLQGFYLIENQLTSLPASIANLLGTIKKIDLRGNLLVERGKEGTFGWKDLEELFGDRVLLS